MNDSRLTNRALLVCAAILIAIAAVVVWKEYASLLQAVPGFLALLLVALMARFFAFVAAMIATVVLAGGFWFFILPNAFPADSTSLMTLRLSLFLLAAIAIGAVSRRRAEELIEAEERYQSLVELSPDGIGVGDENARFVYVNRALMRMVGATDASQMLGKPIVDFIHPDFRARAQERVDRLTAGEQIRPRETKWLTFDGRTVDVEGVSVAVRHRGKVWFHGFVRDLTERKKTEAELNAAARRMAALFDSALDGIAFFDRDGRYVDVNPAGAALLGYTRDQIVGKRIGTFTSPENKSAMESVWEKMQRGESVRGEFTLVDKNGELRGVELATVPFVLPDLHAVFVHDVTARKAAERAMQQLSALLVDAETLGQTGSWEQDLVSGQIFNTEANRRLFFGNDRSKGAQMEDYFTAIHPDDRERVMTSRERLHAGTGPGDIEFRVVWPDGSVHWIFGRATIVRDEAGRPLRAYGTNADITERKRAEEELGQRAQQLAALSARLLQSQDEERRRIARELHDTTAQNLAALRMDLSALKRSAAAADPSMGETIDESIALTERSIAEIRTLSYLLHPPMIEQAGLLPSLRWYAHGFEERSGIAVTLDVPDELERLPIEMETAVFRIVQEVLTNIQRHSGSTVASIRLRREPHTLTLEIRDEGRGIPPALRGDENTLAAAGVGIAGMRERARELGGRMEIRSDDHGTTVAVRLPIEET